jgi:hypothetical protein
VLPKLSHLQLLPVIHVPQAQPLRSPQVLLQLLQAWLHKLQLLQALPQLQVQLLQLLQVWHHKLQLHRMLTHWYQKLHHMLQLLHQKPPLHHHKPQLPQVLRQSQVLLTKLRQKPHLMLHKLRHQLHLQLKSLQVPHQLPAKLTALPLLHQKLLHQPLQLLHQPPLPVMAHWPLHLQKLLQVTPTM